jgi:hypothetical protein
MSLRSRQVILSLPILGKSLLRPTWLDPLPSQQHTLCKTYHNESPTVYLQRTLGTIFESYKVG